MRSQWARLMSGVGVVVLCAVGLMGCDYWPPALQAQIEQLQAEAQTAAADRAKLLNQLNETTKIKEELQARVEEVSRSNRELMAKVSALEQTLTAEREKLARVAKATQKSTAKTTVKPAVKKSDRKKPTTVKKRA